MRAARPRPIWLPVLFLVACGRDAIVQRVEEIAVAPGVVHEGRIEGGVPHRFRVRLAAGHFLRLTVEQRGVDVAALLRDPAGRLMYEVDGPTGASGPEPVLAVTGGAGDYLLDVEPLQPGAGGSFAVVVHELHPATAAERRRAASAAALARADRRRLEGRFEEAVAAYREALPLLRAEGGREADLATAEWHLGEAVIEVGELRRAAAVLMRAAGRFRRLGDGFGEAHALTDLGGAQRLLGDTAGALVSFQRTLVLYREAENERGEATANHNIGLVLETTGDLDAALGHFEAALATWQKLGARSEAATLERIGAIYSLIGHDAEALDVLERAYRLVEATGDEARRVSVLTALAWTYHLAGRPEEALARFDEAIALANARRERLAEASAWGRRGAALRAVGRLREAAGSYERALAMSRAAGNRLSEGHTLANLGWIDLELGKDARARDRLARAVEILAASDDTNGEAYARIGLARAERRRAAFGPARRQIDIAIGLVEDIQAGLRGPLSRAQFRATRYSAYEELVALLMELDRREPAAKHALTALEAAERVRARALREETAGSEGVAGPRRTNAVRQQTLLAEVAAIEERRSALAAEDRRDPRIQRLDAAIRRRGLELDRLEAVAAPVRKAAASLSAAEIRALADEDTLLVVYLLAEPESFAWTVDRDAVVPHVLPGRKRIDRLARRAVAALPRSHDVAGRRTAAQALRALSKAVLAPLASRLTGRKRLVFLVDGALHLVPFAALPPPTRGAASAVPLVVDHEIVHLPSATFLAEHRRRLAGRTPAPGTIAVLADPLFAPPPSQATSLVAAGGHARSGHLGERGSDLGNFEPLPWTATEAEAIARLVPRDRRLVALGSDATRELVLSGALTRFRIVHFATHGVLHPVLPERSGIVLSLVDADGRRREGFVSAPDIAALDLPAELVVLSACETGLGRELRGEGLVGLNHALFRAGARRSLVSYWKVRDRATAELMARFYEGHLSRGLSPAAALRAAQLSIRGEPRWQAPFFWAGFALHGDWRE